MRICRLVRLFVVRPNFPHSVWRGTAVQRRRLQPYEFVRPMLKDGEGETEREREKTRSLDLGRVRRHFAKGRTDRLEFSKLP